MQIHGHADFAQEALERADPFRGGHRRVRCIRLHAHHIHGKLCETADVLRIHVPRPGGPDGSQAGSVRHIEHPAQFVFQFVAGPVPHQAALRQAVVRQASAPHDLRAGAIILRIRQHLEHIFLHGPQQGLRDAVGQVHVVLAGKIPFHRVHHDIRHAGRRLVRRQSIGQFGIQGGKPRPAEGAGNAPLVQVRFVGNHTGVAHLAARGREGEHAAHRQGRLRFRAAQEEIPHIARIGNPVRNGLAHIDHAAAAHRQQEIDSFFPAKVDTLPRHTQARIGDHTAKRQIINSFLRQLAANPVQQARPAHTATAEHDQHPGAAIFLQQGGHLLLRIPTENHLGRRVIRKSFHYK